MSKQKRKETIGVIINYDLDYSNCYNYEYLIKEYISKLIPIPIEKEDWNNAKFYHYSESECKNSSKKMDSKFNINIECNKVSEGNYEIVFSSTENKLIVPLSKIKYELKICGAVREIHKLMVNIPLEHKRTVFSKQYVDALYKSAISMGICLWLQNHLVGYNSNNDYEQKIELDSRGELFYNILEKYDEWSSKTYEGHPVSFGFFIDRNDMSSTEDELVKYIDILNTNDFAPITEIPMSVVKIDENGNVKKYISRYEINEYNKFSFYYHPLEVRDFIKICCIKNIQKIDYIGVLLLKNSEIAIIKNSKLEWLKRNGKWYNYNYSYFNKCLNNSSVHFTQNQIEKLFSIILNLSFAKTGGCISVIDKKFMDNFINKFNENNWFDNLSYDEGKENEKLYGSSNEKIDFFKSRISKKKKIKNFIKDNNFYNIDSRLLLELSSMDGATIIDNEGKFIAISSIVDLTERGEGGGRSAAAKTLSKYGISIKVSTDGYFEIYQNAEVIYSLK